MQLKRIKETCIYVNDLDRTKAFYHELLGLEVISLISGRHVFFRAGESVLLCFIAAKTEMEQELPPHGAYGRIHFAFEVPRAAYDEALEQVGKAGITVLHKHEWGNGLRSFYFSDPDENLVEVIEEGLWEN